MARGKDANVREGVSMKRDFDKDSWTPKTKLGKLVKTDQITDINEILDKGLRILEGEIVDSLVTDLEMDFAFIGQSKGKFGGGKKSIWRQTQKKTKEGNKPKFTSVVIVGNKNGYLGMGRGKAKETVPAREKAIYQAKLNLIKIKRGCGSWACGCKKPHTIPFEVQGKCGSVIIKLMPAPKGTGLCVQEECKKILKLAGISDVHSKTLGQTGTKLNLVYACFDAVKQLTNIKIMPNHIENLGIIEGKLNE